MDEQNTGVGCESATLSSIQTTQTATLSASVSSGSRSWNWSLASFIVTLPSTGNPCVFVICD